LVGFALPLVGFALPLVAEGSVTAGNVTEGNATPTPQPSGAGELIQKNNVAGMYAGGQS
jgi:hypothetical protein